MKHPALKYFLSDEARAAGLSFSAPRELDAGFDIRCIEAHVVEPGTFKLIKTGLHLAVPAGYVCLIKDRSSVALRGGATTAGVIDASYRGEVRVLMHNLAKENLSFEAGERVAQCVLVAHLSELEEASKLEDLGSTERGTGGFGSTGRT